MRCAIDSVRGLRGHEDFGDGDVVARRTLEADRVPGIDDLDLVARQGEVAMRLRAAAVDQGGEQAPVAGVDAAHQRPAAREHVAALDAARAAAGGDEDAAHEARRIIAPYVALPLVGPVRQHEVVRHVLDHAPGGRAAAPSHGGQGIDAARQVGLAAAEPRRLEQARGAGRFQLGHARRQHLAKIVDGGGPLAQDRNERLGPCDHLRVSSA